MLNTKKILILEEDKVTQDLIKKQFLLHDAQCLFIIAIDRASFFKKIHWFSYDFIVSAEMINNISGLEAFGFVQENLMVAPFLLISKKTNEKEVLEEAVNMKIDGVLFRNHLDKLSSRINKIADRKAVEKKSFERLLQKLNKQKILLQKLTEEIYNTPYFDGKTKIESILGELIKNQ